MKRALPVLLLAAGSAVAGPYDQPYALITVDRARSSDPNLRPVVVNRVDGETVLSGQPAVVAPGRHQVTIDLPPRRGFKTASQHTFELEARACTRYHVAARLDLPATQDWKPVVRSQEPIGECARRFPAAGAK